MSTTRIKITLPAAIASQVDFDLAFQIAYEVGRFMGSGYTTLRYNHSNRDKGSYMVRGNTLYMAVEDEFEDNLYRSLLHDGGCLEDGFFVLDDAFAKSLRIESLNSLVKHAARVVEQNREWEAERKELEKARLQRAYREYSEYQDRIRVYPK